MWLIMTSSFKMDSIRRIFIICFGYLTLLYGANGFRNDPKCGQNNYRHPKIIGGEGVEEAEFPWYVSIKETGQHICAGFIVSRNTVMSASHCFKDFSSRAAASPKTISITLAVHYMNRRKSDFPKSEDRLEQEVKVKRIIRHPQYDAFNESSKYDIALLVLETAIQWNYGTRPVCLPASLPTSYSSASQYFTISSDLEEFQSGEVAVVAGWSSTDDREGSILQKVQLTLYSNEECRHILREKNVTMKTDIDSSVICAGSNDVGFDSCSGDSGSALMVRRNNAWVAVGLVSSGFGKCGSTRPGLYTRITSYLDWIQSLIG